MTFLLLFGHTEAVLGESTFEMSNKLQMKKLQVVWKVELKTFQMSYHGLNLDARKCPKSRWKGARCTGVFGTIFILSSGNEASLTTFDL